MQSKLSIGILSHQASGLGEDEMRKIHLLLFAEECKGARDWCFEGITPGLCGFVGELSTRCKNTNLEAQIVPSNPSKQQILCVQLFPPFMQKVDDLL